MWQYCPHCRPTKRKNHWFLYLSYYFEKVFLCVYFFLKKFFLFSYIEKIASSNKTNEILFSVFNFLRISDFETEINQKYFFNRTLIFWKEAKRRSLRISNITLFDKHTDLFRLKYNNEVFYFQTYPLDYFEDQIEKNSKKQTKVLLEKNNIPVPKWWVYTNRKQVFNDFWRKFNFPLIVKPNTWSLSHHITTNIVNKKQLEQGIKIAKQYRPDFIVEEYLEWDFFRVTVIAQKHLFVCKKDQANIIWDWKSTIKELINKKNKHHQRWEIDEISTTLHQIEINKYLINNLKKQNLNLESVPDQNEKVYLHNKLILTQWCDIIDKTIETHPDNVNLFKKISQILTYPIIWIDFIALDIQQSWKNQKCWVLEVNNFPYMDMHRHPTHWESHTVEKYVWDEFFQKL